VLEVWAPAQHRFALRSVRDTMSPHPPLQNAILSRADLT
jgi:hypothetical protein